MGGVEFRETNSDYTWEVFEVPRLNYRFTKCFERAAFNRSVFYNESCAPALRSLAIRIKSNHCKWEVLNSSRK